MPPIRPREDRVGTALADPARCRVLVHLIDGPGYPAEMAEESGTTRANLSNHLSCLRGCGLVTATAEGRRVRYELAAAWPMVSAFWPRWLCLAAAGDIALLISGGDRMSLFQLLIHVGHFAAAAFCRRLSGVESP